MSSVVIMRESFRVEPVSIGEVVDATPLNRLASDPASDNFNPENRPPVKKASTAGRNWPEFRDGCACHIPRRSRLKVPSHDGPGEQPFFSPRDCRRGRICPIIIR